MYLEIRMLREYNNNTLCVPIGKVDDEECAVVYPPNGETASFLQEQLPA